MKQRFRTMPAWVRNPLVGILFLTPLFTFFYIIFILLNVNARDFFAIICFICLLLCFVSLIGLTISRVLSLD